MNSPRTFSFRLDIMKTHDLSKNAHHGWKHAWGTNIKAMSDIAVQIYEQRGHWAHWPHFACARAIVHFQVTHGNYDQDNLITTLKPMWDLLKRFEVFPDDSVIYLSQVLYTFTIQPVNPHIAVQIVEAEMSRDAIEYLGRYQERKRKKDARAARSGVVRHGRSAAVLRANELLHAPTGSVRRGVSGHVSAVGGK